MKAIKKQCGTCIHYGIPDGFVERKGFVTAHPCLYPMPVIPKLPDWCQPLRIEIERGKYRWADNGQKCECWKKKKI